MSDAAEIFKVSHTYRGVPVHLAGTDRVLQRWAVSVGDGYTDLAWHELTRCKIPPLDDPAAIVVDQLILAAPPRARKIVSIWYRKPVPRETIARELGIDSSVVQHNWLCALEYFRGRFEYSPFQWLRAMALIDPVRDNRA